MNSLEEALRASLKTEGKFCPQCGTGQGCEHTSPASAQSFATVQAERWKTHPPIEHSVDPQNPRNYIVAICPHDVRLGGHRYAKGFTDPAKAHGILQKAIPGITKDHLYSQGYSDVSFDAGPHREHAQHYVDQLNKHLPPACPSCKAEFDLPHNATAHEHRGMPMEKDFRGSADPTNSGYYEWSTPTDDRVS